MEANIRLVRDEGSLVGFFSKNSVSTDAENAVNTFCASMGVGYIARNLTEGKLGDCLDVCLELPDEYDRGLAVKTWSHCLSVNGVKVCTVARV